MFTLKFYTWDDAKMRIETADSMTILKGDGGAEITMHRKDGNDIRIDIESEQIKRYEGWPNVYQKVIIENAGGRTTEIIYAGNTDPRMGGSPPPSKPA